MGKQHWKPGNMLNPVPAVMVSVTDKDGRSNIITVACEGRFVRIRLWCQSRYDRHVILIK